MIMEIERILEEYYKGEKDTLLDCIQESRQKGEEVTLHIFWHTLEGIVHHAGTTKEYLYKAKFPCRVMAIFFKERGTLSEDLLF
jgi:hypothetical protein